MLLADAMPLGTGRYNWASSLDCAASRMFRLILTVGSRASRKLRRNARKYKILRDEYASNADLIMGMQARGVVHAPVDYYRDARL